MTSGIKTKPTKSKLTNTVNSLKAIFFGVLWSKVIGLMMLEVQVR